MKMPTFKSEQEKANYIRQKAKELRVWAKESLRKSELEAKQEKKGNRIPGHQ
jgi:hypothetical protein